MQIDFGNPVRTFGAKLPTPYIEQVRVYDNYHIVRLALYFQIPFDMDPEEYFDSISSDLGDVVVFQIVDGYIPIQTDGLLPHSGTVSSGRTSMAASILNNTYSILEMWTTNEASFQLSEEDDLLESAWLQFTYNAGSSATKVPVSDFELCTSLDGADTKICKFIYHIYIM